jgi:hypothetical protein
MSNLNNSVTQYGVQELGNLFLSVTGGKVFYVGTAAMIAQYPDVGVGIANRLFTDVNTALGQCVSGRGDVIYVLPGYTESIATSDAWSNLAATDVTIIGMGRGTNRPTFTWTATGSTVLFDTANFKLINCQLYLAGAHAAGAALTVAAPITVSAAGCEISNCQIFWGFDADQIVTIGITTTAAADWFRFNSNTCYAETAAVPTTTFMRLVGADYFQMWDTKIQGPGSTTTLAPVQFLTTASLAIDIRRCIIQNTLASSIHAVTGMAGLTGTAIDCLWGILDNATLVGFVTPASMQFGYCYTSNLAGENGGAMTPVST